MTARKYHFTEKLHSSPLLEHFPWQNGSWAESAKQYDSSYEASSWKRLSKRWVRAYQPVGRSFVHSSGIQIGIV